MLLTIAPRVGERACGLRTTGARQNCVTEKIHRMRKKLLIGLGVVVGLVLVFVLVVVFRPNQFHVQRSMTMAAPAAAAFEQVNNLRHWDAWSPWAHIDPNMQQTYEGPEEGVGAIYSWSGNDEVGAGRMTIVESRPAELVKLQLEFFRPFESTSTSQFTFEPVGEQTRVTWSMSGDNNFISKAMQLFMDMDQMLGSQFEAGLSKLKATVENQADPDPAVEPPVPGERSSPEVAPPVDVSPTQ